MLADNVPKEHVHSLYRTGKSTQFGAPVSTAIEYILVHVLVYRSTNRYIWGTVHADTAICNYNIIESWANIQGHEGAPCICI